MILDVGHFEEFFALPDVVVASGFDDLVGCLNALASAGEAEARGARLKLACSRFVTEFDQPWRNRLVDFLRAIADRPPARQSKRSIA